MVKLNVSSFRAELKGYLGSVEKAIFEELKHYRGSVFFTPLKYATRGGGRIRPIMVILAYECVGGDKILDPLPAAVAVELAHTESLVHDDIIDKDDSRRGSAAFHALYGWGLSALSADFILSMILNIASRYGDPRVTRALALAARRMCEGELEELEVQKNKHKINVDKFIDILEKKTAALFEVSAKLGAIIGGGSDEDIEALSEYGRLVGIAYQIQDDIVDWKTSPLVKMVELSNSESNKEMTIKHLEKMSLSCIIDAKLELEKLKPGHARDLLAKLAEYVITSHSHTPTAKIK